jgi:hypothetical protein
MAEDEIVPRLSPYRQCAELHERKPAREVSVGVVACCLMFLVVLAATLSVEPSRGESFGGLSAWCAAGRAAAHHR